MRIWRCPSFRATQPDFLDAGRSKGKFLTGAYFLVSQPRRVTGCEGGSLGFSGTVTPGCPAGFCTNGRSVTLAQYRGITSLSFLFGKLGNTFPCFQCPHRAGVSSLVDSSSRKDGDGCPPPDPGAAYRFIFRQLHLKCKCNFGQCLIRRHISVAETVHRDQE